MEPGGLAVGVFALAGLFNNAVDCFEYVQLGRSFGTNFQTSLLKLDHARVRLSRWGEAVGISGDLEDTRSLKDATIKQEDIANAQMILGQILELFADAEKSSAKYKNFKTADDPNLTVLEAPADMDAVGLSLHEKMRALCIKRQNSSKLYQKAKWALHDKKHFKRLIEDIKELVDALLDLFPSVKQEQLKLCEAEVSEIGVESLPVLSDIVRSQDEALEEAIYAAIKSAVGKQSTTFNNYNSKIANQAASMAIHGGQTINL